LHDLLSRYGEQGTLRRILEVRLPSKPYRYPRLPQAAKTLSASGVQRSGQGRKNTKIDIQ